MNVHDAMTLDQQIDLEVNKRLSFDMQEKVIAHDAYSMTKEESEEYTKVYAEVIKELSC